MLVLSTIESLSGEIFKLEVFASILASAVVLGWIISYVSQSRNTREDDKREEIIENNQRSITNNEEAIRQNRTHIKEVEDAVDDDAIKRIMENAKKSDALLKDIQKRQKRIIQIEKALEERFKQLENHELIKKIDRCTDTLDSANQLMRHLGSEVKENEADIERLERDVDDIEEKQDDIREDVDELDNRADWNAYHDNRQDDEIENIQKELKKNRQ